MTISLIVLKCPNCNSEDINKAGSISNKQRYVCKKCNKYFVPDYIDLLEDFLIDFIRNEKDYYEKWRLIRIAIQLVRDSLDNKNGEYVNDNADQAEYRAFYGEYTLESKFSNEYEKFLSKYHNDDRYVMAENIFIGKKLSAECKDFILQGLVTDVFFRDKY